MHYPSRSLPAVSLRLKGVFNTRMKKLRVRTADH
jgi:hypothetical protein